MSLRSAVYNVLMLAERPNFGSYSHLCRNDREQTLKNIRNVLNDTLSTKHSEMIPDLFTKVFATGLKKFIIQDSLNHHNYALVDILNNPNVDKSELEFIDIAGPTAQAMYLLISDLPFVKKLALEPFRIYGDPAIEKILHDLQLKELEVRCSARPCIFANSQTEHLSWQRLLQILEWHCNSLTSLKLSCTCKENQNNTAKEMATIAAVIPNLSNIAVRTNSHTAEMVMERIGSMTTKNQNIELHLTGDRTEVTRYTPQTCLDMVKSVEIQRAQTADVEMLSIFKNADEVKLEVMDDAEKVFDTTILENTRSFHISGSPAAASWPGGIYYEFKNNCVHRAISNMPHLEDVRISHCKIGKREITTILTEVGKRLKVFETSILDQEESPSERLLDLIKCMSLANPSLREFHVSDSVTEEIAMRNIWGKRTYEEYWQLYKGLLSARKELVRAAPRLESMEIFELIDSLEPNRYVVDWMQHNVLEDADIDVANNAQDRAAREDSKESEEAKACAEAEILAGRLAYT